MRQIFGFYIGLKALNYLVLTYYIVQNGWTVLLYPDLLFDEISS